MLSQKNEFEHRVPDDTKGGGHHQQAGASSFVSSSKNKLPNESCDMLMGDASTVVHDTPSEITERIYVTTTGPTPLGEAIGFQGQVCLVSEGNLACTRSKDGKQWRVHRQENPKRCALLFDDRRIYNHVSPESVAMCKALSIHHTFEYYLNHEFSFYRPLRTKGILEFILSFVKDAIEGILVDIPESVVLIRCDFPLYDSVDPESRVVIEHVILEYFRSPWRLNWTHRFRSAMVQKSRPWFKSVTGEEDEVFPDDPLLIDYVAQSLDASTSSYVVDQMPAATLSTSTLDVWMEIDTRPPSTAAGSADTASQQDDAVAHPFCTPPLQDKPTCACQSLTQVCLCVNSTGLTREYTSGSSTEVTDSTDAINGDGVPNSEYMDTDTKEEDISLIDVTLSFPQDPAVSHPTTCLEAKFVGAIIKTDSSAVTSKKVDNPLLLVAKECHNGDDNYYYNNHSSSNNISNTEEPRHPAHIPKPVRIKVTNSKSDRRYYCVLNDCTKSYAKQGGLDVHIKSCHTLNGRQKCAFPPCTKTFAQPADCKRHENVTHKGHMYVCDNCGERYTRKPSAKDLKVMLRCRSGAEGLHNFILYIPESWPEPKP